jgi:hypothetical protein
VGETRYREEKRYNFIQAFLMFLVALSLGTLLYLFIANRVDTWALETCEKWNDCEAVINQINR